MIIKMIAMHIQITNGWEWRKWTTKSRLFSLTMILLSRISPFFFSFFLVQFLISFALLPLCDVLISCCAFDDDYYHYGW